MVSSPTIRKRLSMHLGGLGEAEIIRISAAGSGGERSGSYPKGVVPRAASVLSYG